MLGYKYPVADVGLELIIFQRLSSGIYLKTKKIESENALWHGFMQLDVTRNTTPRDARFVLQNIKEFIN